MPIPTPIVIGHPLIPPDPCDLLGYIYLPDPVLFGPGPYPGIVATRSGGMQDGGPQESRQTIEGITGVPMSGLVQHGFICMHFDVRLMKGQVDGEGGAGLPGQTTDGRYPQQSDDYTIGVNFMRNHALCNGFVGGLGGSGSGFLALYNACTAAGSDRLDAVICLSGPTDWGARTADELANPHFGTTATSYNRSHDLAVLTAQSPVALVDATAPPIYIANGNGGGESMPHNQLVEMTAALNALGLTNFISHENLNGRHSFGTWAENWPLAIPFMEQAWADWDSGGGGGGEPPPPPPPPPPPIPNQIGLIDYSWKLEGGPGMVDGAIGPDAVSAPIIGLGPSLLYTFSLRANNLYGSSPWISTQFTSDAAAGGGGGGGGGGGTGQAPLGIIDFLPSVDGVVNDMAGLGVWTLPYIVGCRLHTDWGTIQPSSEAEYDWSQIDAFLALCAANRKSGGISISTGTGSPSWLTAVTFTDGGGRTYPLPWDTTYIIKWSAFVAAFAARYDGNRSLAYVVPGGLGRDAESAQSYLIRADDTTSGADVTALTALAVASHFRTIVDGWDSAARSIVQAYSVFRSSAVIYDLYYPVPIGTPTKDGAQGLADLVSFVTRNGLARNLGFMDELLVSATDGTNPIDFLITSQVGAQTGFKTLTESVNAPDFLATLNAGVALNPNFIEILDADAVKPDPYPAYIQDAAQAIKTNKGTRRVRIR